MNASKQAAWLFCLLLTLACSGFYYASSTPIKRLDEKTLAKAADIIITNFTVRRFDEKGTLINYLQASLVQHVPENNTHFFTSPYVTISQADQSMWEITAKQAIAIKGSQEIRFNQDVVVHQNKGEQEQGSILRTEELIYFPKDKLAKTDLPVSFEQPGGIIRSKGMIAYLEEKRVQLLSQTRATFEPKHA